MPTIKQRTGSVATSTAMSSGPITIDSPSPSAALSGAPSVASPVSPFTVSRGSAWPGSMVPGAAQQGFVRQAPGIPRTFLRPILGIDPVVQRVSLKTLKQGATPPPPLPAGQPHVLLETSATSQPYKTKTGEVKCLVSVSFAVNPADAALGVGARIWFFGYHGSGTMQLMCEGSTSPVSFLADATGDDVTVYAEAVSAAGTLCAGPVNLYSPKTTLVLSPVTNAPASPSMAQTLTGTPTGYQFQFNQLAGLAANVIDGYAIYRNTTNSTVGAAQIAYIKQNPSASGPILYHDVAAQGQTYYYWIGACDTSGNESALTSAQNGAITPISVFDPTGKLWGPANITGVSAAPMTLQQLHDNTALTLNAHLLQNPNFAAGNVGWSLGYGWSIQGGQIGPSSESTLGIYQGPGTAAIVNNQSIPCAPGAVIAAACKVYGGTGATGYADIRINFYQSSTLLQTIDGNHAGAGIGWNQSRVVATAPANTTQCVVDFAVYSETTANAWYVSEFSASILPNSLAEVNDDPAGVYNRVGYVNGDHTFHASTAFIPQGSFTPVIPIEFSVNYTVPSTGQATGNLSVSAGSILLPNGATVNIPGNTTQNYNVTGGTTYTWYARINVLTGLVDATPGPQITPNAAAAQYAQNDGWINIGTATGSAPPPPSSGTTSGGTTTSPTPCPDGNELVRVFQRGIIPCVEVKAGDDIEGWDFRAGEVGFRRVKQVKHRESTTWVRVLGRKVSPHHPISWLDECEWQSAYSRSDCWDFEPGVRVQLTVDESDYDDQNFVIYNPEGTRAFVMHNAVPSPIS